MDIGTIFTFLGAILLFLTSTVHLFKGYPRLQDAIKTKKIDLPSFSRNTRDTMSFEEIRVMWLAFGIHLMIVSVLIIFLIFRGNETTQLVVIILAVVPVMDALLLKALIKGIHLGAPLLALSGLLILVGQIVG